MLRIPAAELDAAVRDAAAAYPHEACGALVGNARPAGKDVVRVVPVANARRTERERRYLIPPAQIQRIEVEAARNRLELLGFYHSHPDHAAEPSDFDRDNAWPWYAYLILPVTRDGVGEARVWRLADDRSGFGEEPLSVVAETRGGRFEKRTRTITEERRP